MSNRNGKTAVVILVVIVLIGGLGPTGTTTHAQEDGDACPALVTEALNVAGTACAGVGRNEACYGHTLVAATFQEGVTGISFEQGGDIAPLVDLRALVTQPADPAAGTWGIALLKVQADLPDEGDAALTFVLFGDTEVTTAAASDAAPSAAPTCAVTNAGGSNINVRGGPGTGYEIVDVLATGAETVADGRNAASDWVRIALEGDAVGWVSAPLVALDCEIETLNVVEGEEAAPALPSAYTRPMQAFTLRTGATSPCTEAPDGLLIESPAGQRTHLMANGVQLEFASKGFLTAEPDGALTITGLDGVITVTAFDESVTVIPGYQTTVALDGLEAASPPHAPTSIDQNPVQGLVEIAQSRPETSTDSPVIETIASEPSGQYAMVVVAAALYDWVDSGITLSAGQPFGVTASGTVNLWTNCEETKGDPNTDCGLAIGGPDGAPLLDALNVSPDVRATLPIPSAKEGALIARIGGGAPFLVGTGGTFTADADGLLQFRVNNHHPENADDDGTFTVIVIVE